MSSTEEQKSCNNERQEMEELLMVLLKRQQMQEVVRMMGSEFCCPVCQNLVTVATMANCGHMFCQKCIRTWCIDYGRRNCPVCRVQIVARVRALPVDRFILRCLEEAGEADLLKELLAAASDAGSVFESDRAPVKATSATFFFEGVSIRSTAATSAGSDIGSFGISSD